MQWWNDLVEWVYSDAGWRIVSTAILPFVAIIVAVLISAAIARGSVKRLIVRQDRESSAAAVATVINVARRSAVWSRISGPEQDHLAYQSSEATTRLRLLPISGASLASDWAEHQITEIKRNSTGFSVQAEQSSVEVRDRLIDWHSRPSRAKKLFAADIDQFRYEDQTVDKDLIEKQRQWAAKQSASEKQPADPFPSSIVTPATPPATANPTTPLVPPASSRAFTPAAPAAASPSSTTEPRTDPTEVVHATIDDEAAEIPTPRPARDGVS